MEGNKRDDEDLKVTCEPYTDTKITMKSYIDGENPPASGTCTIDTIMATYTFNDASDGKQDEMELVGTEG